IARGPDARNKPSRSTEAARRRRAPRNRAPARRWSLGPLAAPVLSNERDEQAHDVLRGLAPVDAHSLEQSRGLFCHPARAVGTREPRAGEVVGDVHERAAHAVDTLHADAVDELEKVLVSVEEAHTQEPRD